MSAIELADEIADDFERIFDHLAAYQVEHPEQRIRDIIEALDVLEHNPEIGRPVAAGKRELVIGRGSRGYVALYRYIEEVARFSYWRSAASGKAATPSEGNARGRT